MLAKPFLLRSCFALFAIARGASAQSDSTAAILDPVSVTATRRAERVFDVPASIDLIEGATIRDSQPAINISEPLVRVPGVFAANRYNYAQDVQISSRGFGARSAFGVRGVRLYQDLIPLTMPDGQGQTGSFSLLSAKRIEVLRGPFSTLYGNASGGVISVFTEDPSATPVMEASLAAGSFSTYNAGLKALGSAHALGYVVAVNHVDTEGYREHSAATRDIANVKLVTTPTESTRVTVIGNVQHQPNSEDPLGLTQAQVNSDPRQADPVALLFDTRKTVNQTQGGIAIEHDFNGETTLRMTAYGGERQIGQYLAFSGVAMTSSGGVVNLDRNYGGLGARLVIRRRLADGPLTFSIGVDGDRLNEQRQGFVNNAGTQGGLRRDEDDSVGSFDAYAELEWSMLPAVSVTLGARASRVRYDSVDHYIVGPNPDDSGARTYNNTSPIAAVVWHSTDTLNLYLSYGQGFETPTFAEMAYRTVGPGLNLDLDPATSKTIEAGLKWLPWKSQRFNLAVFSANTSQEIVINSATGGRTTYRNASSTTRYGLEAEWQADLSSGLVAHVNYSYLRATFGDDYVAGVPPVRVPAGSRLPGAPPQQAFAALTWTPAGAHGFSVGGEIQYVGRIYVNDINSAFAPAYTIANAHVGFAQVAGTMRFSEYVRVNNLASVNYIGSVIVGDTNGRYFEPAPGRNWFAGVSVNMAF